jgi:hypothetical protein
MTDKELKEKAEESKLLGNNDLAIVLYTYLGSKHLNMSSDFARHCQSFAKKGVEEIDMNSNRENN